MKQIVMLLVILVLLSAVSVSAFGYTTARHDTFEEPIAACTDSGMIRLGFSGKTLQIERIAPDPFCDSVELSCPIAAVTVSGDAALALCDSFDDGELVVYRYEIGTGVMENYRIPYAGGYHRGFFLDSEGVVIQDDDRPSVLYRYSLGGVLKGSYDFHGSSVSLIPGYRAGLYVLCDGRLYRSGSGGYQPIGGAAVSAPASFIADDTLADGHGNLYRISGDQCRVLLQTGIHSGYPAAALMNGDAYLADGSTLYRYNMTTGQRTDYLETEAPISALYSCGGSLYAITDTAAPAVLCLAPSEFVPCPAEQPSPSVLSGISSAVYRIDSENYRITRIPSPTTFAQLKANICHDGFQAQLYRGGKAVKSGSVGTAMTVVFSGEDSYVYELSVIGDITGEGSVNSRDVGELMDYFLGNICFDGVYIDAADISDDGRVDMLDLALLCRSAQ